MVIQDMAEGGGHYVALWCDPCGRHVMLIGDDLAARFRAWPGLTTVDLKRRCVCRHCGASGSITIGWQGPDGYVPRLYGFPS